MAKSEILRLLMQSNQLKRTSRTGWVQRGVPQAENVAAHTNGVAFTALVLAKLISSPLQREKLLIMALIHDLPETITTDIPTGSWRFFPPGTKADVERRAMMEVLGGSVLEAELMPFWEEMQRQETAEAKLVHDADKLEMYVQAFVYERETGNQFLEEFWLNPRHFFFAESQAVYDELVSLRKEE
jgi:putative hydrolase of HD superfamily